MSQAIFIRKNVVIVGGGFSGTVLAVQLLRQAPNLSLAIIDQGSVPGRGLAYGTAHECHLLNVPACDMSAFPSEPEHFLNWARVNYDGNVEPRSFLPRSLYGRYLGSLLGEVQALGHLDFEWIRAQAVSVRREGDGFALRCGDGSTVLARTLVLAMGNYPPGNLGVPGLNEQSERYVRFAWSDDALAGLSANDSVLLIGSGLTSVDMAIALHARGYKGKIHILSRHGLIPLAHRQIISWPRFWDDHSPRSARGLMRLIRNQVDCADAAGANWRSVMDSLRPFVQEIWQSLPEKERRRFLRHARAYWEVHRHRIAPEVADAFSRMIESGQVEIQAGRVLSYSEVDDAADVTFCNRSTGATESLRVARVINCSGPETDCRKIESPLLASLFAQGLVRQDALGLGLDVAENGSLVDANGRPSERLYGIGPLRKGSLWETTAVPELRVQAEDLSECLLQANVRSEESSAFSAETVSASRMSVRLT
jgi:uncharacterized NAD(P)/FAD-binding protein YdhS